MKKLLFLFICTSFLFASPSINVLAKESEKRQKNHTKVNHIVHLDFSAGYPIPYPTLGFGYRLINNIHGLDVSFKSYPRYLYQISIDYLNYFSKTYKKEIYAGIGCSFSYIHTYKKNLFSVKGDMVCRKEHLISPKFFFGGMIGINKYIQIDLLIPHFIFPYYANQKWRVLEVAAITSTYGFMF